MPDGSFASRVGDDRFTSLLCLVAVLVFFLPQVVEVQFADPDLWGRLSVGAAFFQAGHLPEVDDYSYLAQGARWIDHEWASGVVFYAVLDAFGEDGLHVLKYGLIALCFVLVFALRRRVYGLVPLVTLLTLLILSRGALPGFIATLRAQAFSFPLSLGFLLILEGVRLERFSLRTLAWPPTGP